MNICEVSLISFLFYFFLQSGARSQKQLLLPELMRNGVNMDVRKLQVGDFLWVAREKLAPRVGQLKMPERREVVLDFVVERKRMDDLCSSMQDGRFREQKVLFQYVF